MSAQPLNVEQLNRALQICLCRFCGKPNTPEDKFIASCNCQGPNASIHKACLEDWLPRSKKTKCDVCCFEYKANYSKRSLLEWLRADYAAGHLGQLRQLGARLMTVMFMFAFSCYFTHVLTQGLKCYDRNRGLYFTSCLLMFWALYRVIGGLALLGQFLRIVWQDFQDWRENNPKVDIEPNPNYRSFGSQVPNSSMRASGFNANRTFKAFMDDYMKNQAVA